MAKKKQEKKKRGGTDTIREQGLKALVVPFTQEEKALIEEASRYSGDGAQNAFVRRVAVEATRKLMDEVRARGGITPSV